MNLYTNVLRDITQPLLRGYSLGAFGLALEVIYNVWWVEARRLEWAKAPDKFKFCIQFFLQKPLLGTDPGRWYLQTILNVAKFENINNAYTQRREAYAMIGRAWNGEFDLKDNDLMNRVTLTGIKIVIYMKETFFFYMTCIDAAKSLDFNERAQIEALSSIIDNSARLFMLLTIPNEAEILKKKLRPNVELIQTCFRCDKNTALVLIEESYKTIREIQEHTLTKTVLELLYGLHNGFGIKNKAAKIGDRITSCFSPSKRAGK